MLKISFAVGGPEMGTPFNRHHQLVLHQVPSCTMDCLLVTFFFRQESNLLWLLICEVRGARLVTAPGPPNPKFWLSNANYI
jgi:hypothetical protein